MDKKNLINDLETTSENKIECLMEAGRHAEEQNMAEEAIKCFKEALSIASVENKDRRVLVLYIKIGSLYQLSGDMDDGLTNFKAAYAEAVKQQDKTAQIDLLVKMADVYLCKGNLEESTAYAESADKIAEETDYIQGKLDIYIHLTKIHYAKKEYYKARELCNKALRLCTEDYLLYKGRILNILVELYKDMISVEEHLQLLNQAYECFEKVNFKRGLIGILNNIAYVYSGKLQDYKKALEYYYKVKELCDNSYYVEFDVIAYVNIGEMHFKMFDYEEALHWFKEGLALSNEAYMQNMKFYNYIFLAQGSLKLTHYQEAYDYFISAEKELAKHTYIESILVNYYRLCALLFTEFGEINKAKTFIKQALEAVKKDESMVKWYVGLLYEQIKLKEAEAKSEINDILEGVGYTLSKYKNKEDILDTVYNVVLELISKGCTELAFNFAEEYNHMEPESQRTRIKRSYASFIMDNGHGQISIEELTSALEIAKNIKDTNLHWRICLSLGDYYFKNKDFKKSEAYYKEAYDVINRMTNSVPEEFRKEFIESNYLLEPVNKLKDILEGV